MEDNKVHDKVFEFELKKETEEVDDNPIEQVRLTVPIKDDPTEPALTFRTWVLGLLSCVLLAFVNQFFGYRENQLGISSVAAQIVTLPLGNFMAAALPSKPIRVPMTRWQFSMNPGPFSLKEHVLITIFAGSGAGGVYAVNIVTIVKAFYRRKLNPVAGFLLSQTTQMLGYGWAGMFRKILVDSPYMWWPANLVQVSLFRALHEREERTKGGMTRLQFFVIVFVCSFSYYIIPGYLFPSISSLSFVCWIWKDSITAQQLGSGVRGLGLGAIGLDWSTIAGFLGSPLAYPAHAIVNILVGFFIIVYVMCPITYWSNAYEAKRFPIFSTKTFDSTGQIYNISRVLNEDTFTIDIPAYEGYSKLYLSVFFAFSYGLSFAALTSAISHVMLYHGDTIAEMWRGTKETIRTKACGDVHTRIMKRNYTSVPNWWFYVIMTMMLGLSLLACEGFGKQLQLPWWGLLLAFAIAFFFTLPVGIITATTNMGPGLNVITELVIGYLYPGKPLANVAFKTYGYISMSQAIYFLADFKLGHYMKIPPRSMFVVQLTGTVMATSVYFGTAWWLLESVESICIPTQLPVGSPWTCPGDEVFYNASIIWGVVGPARMFNTLGIYPQMNWLFLFGFLAPFPFWLLSKKIFPNCGWLKLVHTPIIIGATAAMPPARAISYTMWGAVGLFFNVYVYRRFKEWWARHTYILSSALDAGMAFMGIVLFLSLQSYEIFGPNWWGLEANDHCNLASCPTAPGIVVSGCPVL